jgi:hypothetical protein
MGAELRWPLLGIRAGRGYGKQLWSHFQAQDCCQLAPEPLRGQDVAHMKTCTDSTGLERIVLKAKQLSLLRLRFSQMQLFSEPTDKIVYRWPIEKSQDLRYKKTPLGTRSLKCFRVDATPENWPLQNPTAWCRIQGDRLPTLQPPPHFHYLPIPPTPPQPMH